jgi:hypothetical protein
MLPFYKSPSVGHPIQLILHQEATHIHTYNAVHLDIKSYVPSPAQCYSLGVLTLFLAIYQHSAETEKEPALAQQASVNEEQEQRRRQLDRAGEQQRMIVAKEVSRIPLSLFFFFFLVTTSTHFFTSPYCIHYLLILTSFLITFDQCKDLVEEYGGSVHLKSTPYEVPAQPILEQAQAGLIQAQISATNAVSSAWETGKSILNSASAAAGAVAGAAAGAVQTMANSARDTASSALGTAAAVGQDAAHAAANQASNIVAKAAAVGHDAAAQANVVVHAAANQASNIATKAVDTASTAAVVLSQKSKEIATVASDKAHEIADNISHFTTLVGVLAEEENERARRLVSGDEARAAANAFRVSELIRDLGADFYKQTPNLLYTTKVLEEAERRWRLNSSAGELGESNAHREGKLVQNNLQSFMPRYQWVRAHINAIEEKERTRRLTDCAEAWAIQNALSCSFLIRELGLGFCIFFSLSSFPCFFFASYFTHNPLENFPLIDCRPPRGNLQSLARQLCYHTARGE